MRTIEQHQAAFTQAGADGHKQVEAFGHVVTDLVEARAEIGRLKADVERLARVSESALRGEREYAECFGRWADKYRVALRALVRIRDGARGDWVHDAAKTAIEEAQATGEVSP